MTLKKEILYNAGINEAWEKSLFISMISDNTDRTRMFSLKRKGKYIFEMEPSESKKSIGTGDDVYIIAKDKSFYIQSNEKDVDYYLNNDLLKPGEMKQVKDGDIIQEFHKALTKTDSNSKAEYKIFIRR